MKNNIKRVLTLCLLMFFLGCGIFKKSKAPIFIEEVPIEEEAVIEEIGKEHKTISAFSLEHLYQSASKKMKARRKARSNLTTSKLKVEEEVKEEFKDSVSIKSMTEIIQIVDENGNVVASKEIK